MFRQYSKRICFCLVPLVGIEPTPRGLEDRCSCPLSYKGLCCYVMLLSLLYHIPNKKGSDLFGAPRLAYFWRTRS